MHQVDCVGFVGMRKRVGGQAAEPEISFDEAGAGRVGSRMGVEGSHGGRRWVLGGADGAAGVEWAIAVRLGWGAAVLVSAGWRAGERVHGWVGEGVLRCRTCVAFSVVFMPYVGIRLVSGSAELLRELVAS